MTTNNIDNPPHTLNFWCKKIMPLIYDESLSYYEVLCKVVDYLNNMVVTLNGNTNITNNLQSDLAELKTYVELYYSNINVQNSVDLAIGKLVETGVIDSIINNALNAKVSANLLDTADVKLFAQNDMSDMYDGYNQQGFAIGNVNGGTYVLMLLTNDNNTVVTLYNKSTGERINYKEIDLGHANGATFCPKDNCFYIALSGGNVKREEVIALDINLDVVKSIQTPSISLSSVYYDVNEDKFYGEYCGTSYICVFDYNFTLLEKRTLNTGVTGSDVTYQAMSGDSNYLYFVSNGLSYNDKRHFNKIDVYTHDFTYVGTTFFDNIFELEQIQNYKGEFYFCVNTNGCGYLYVGTIFNERKLYNSRSYESLSGLRITTDTLTLWFNSEYTGFLCDGSYKHPIRNLYLVSTLHNKRYTQLQCKLIGDFSAYNFNIKGCPFTEINVLGYSNETTSGQVNLGGIYLENLFRANFSYISVNNRNASKNHSVSLIGVTGAYFGNCIFNASGVEKHIYAINSNVTIRVGKFDTTPTQHYLYCTEGSFCTLENIQLNGECKPCVFRSGVNYITNNPPLNFVKGGALHNTPVPLMFFNNYQGTIHGFTMPGMYYFTSICSLDDVPDDGKFSSALDVQWSSDIMVKYTLITKNGKTYTKLYNTMNASYTSWV